MGSRAERLRLEKVEQRKRMRDLVEMLDPIVPSQPRPASVEKGSLKSKRTLLQLQEDMVVMLRAIRSQEGKPKKLIKVEKAEVAVEEKKDGPVCLNGMLAEGMISSNALLLIEVNIKEWTVLRMSKGLQKWFQLLPAPGLIGQTLLRFVHMQDGWKLRAHTRQAMGESPAPGFEARVLTFGSKSFEFLDCSFTPTHQPVNDRSVFLMQFPFAIPSPPSSYPEWTTGFLRDMSGVFDFDEICSTAFPWEVDSRLKHAHKHMSTTNQVELGWCQRNVNAQLRTETGRAVLEKIAGDAGPQYLSVTGSLMRHVNRMTQMQVLFDITGNDVPVIAWYTRLKLPEHAGSYITPWVRIMKLRLDGTPAEGILSTAGTQLRMYAHRNAPAGEVHITACHNRMVGTEWKCYHSKAWIIYPERMRVAGQIFFGGGDAPWEYDFVFNRTEDPDRGLLSSLVLEGD